MILIRIQSMPCNYFFPLILDFIRLVFSHYGFFSAYNSVVTLRHCVRLHPVACLWFFFIRGRFHFYGGQKFFLHDLNISDPHKKRLFPGKHKIGAEYLIIAYSQRETSFGVCPLWEFFHQGRTDTYYLEFHQWLNYLEGAYAPSWFN